MLLFTGCAMNGRTALGVAAALLASSMAFGQNEPASGSRFDGKWMTTLTCPEKGKTAGYRMQLPTVIQDGNFRGDHGTPGQPGYLLIEGRIAGNGSAKLSATGKVASRKYGTGIFTSEGSDYSYNIRAQFQDAEGTGVRDAGLGIVGRPCTFDFEKQ